jgi:ubiquinone/menaquinone biosynthesis C-methylase UbiE
MEGQHPKSGMPQDFTSPTALPNEKQAAAWQHANRSWWENNPMRYDWKEAIQAPEFSKAFYEEIDRRFFENAREYFPGERQPFASLMGLAHLADKDVLEIGVGNGSHAGLLARHAKTFTGVDLTEYASKSAAIRLKEFGLQGNVRHMDAEHLDFPDASFDFVWSWGVIHHSSNTENILKEIRRVLRPGGKATVMVYYRSWWSYYVAGTIHGIVEGKLSFKNFHKRYQSHTDGAIARYYSIPEWRAFAGKYFKVKKTYSLGPKYDVVLLPAGAFKNAVLRMMPNALNAFLTKELGMGSFLISELVKA